MLREKFTGAELAAEVNDKLSQSDGGTIGQTTFSSEGGVGVLASNNELIPFQPFKIIQYQGNGDPVSSSSQEIQLGFQPKMVMIISHVSYVSDVMNDLYYNTPFAIATSDCPAQVKDGSTMSKDILEITDVGFVVHTTEIHYYPTLNKFAGLNNAGVTYTAFIFV